MRVEDVGNADPQALVVAVSGTVVSIDFRKQVKPRCVPGSDLCCHRAKEQCGLHGYI